MKRVRAEQDCDEVEDFDELTAMLDSCFDDSSLAAPQPAILAPAPAAAPRDPLETPAGRYLMGTRQSLLRLENLLQTHMTAACKTRVGMHSAFPEIRSIIAMEVNTLLVAANQQMFIRCVNTAKVKLDQLKAENAALRAQVDGLQLRVLQCTEVLEDNGYKTPERVRSPPLHLTPERDEFVTPDSPELQFDDVLAMFQ